MKFSNCRFTFRTFLFAVLLLGGVEARGDGSVNGSASEKTLVLYPGSLSDYSVIFLDYTYERIFLTTCEHSSSCLIRHPYVKIQDASQVELAMDEFFRTRDGIFEYLKAQCARLPCDVFRVGGYSLRHKDLDGYASRQKEDDFEKCLQIFLHIIDDENEFYYVRREIFELQTQRNQIYVDNGRAFKCERVGDLAVWRGAFSKIDLLQKFEK